MNIKTKVVTALTLAVLVVPGISFAQTMSVAQLQAEIKSLTAQLQSLKSQLATSLSTSISTSKATPLTTIYPVGCTSSSGYSSTNGEPCAPATTISPTLPIHVCPVWGCNGPEPIVTSTISGGSVLRVTQRNELPSGTITPGNIFQDIGSYWVYAPSTEGVSLHTFTLNVGQNASEFQNLELYVGAAPFGTTQATVGNGGVYTFTGTPVAIPAGSYTEADVYANVLSNATSGATNATTLVGCTATGLVSYGAYTCNSVVGQTMTVGGIGKLTSALSASTPQASYLGMSIVGVHVAQYQFVADNNGSETLTRLVVTDSSISTTSTAVTASHYSDLINYRLTDTNGNVLSTASEQNGMLNFNLTGLAIPVNGTQYVNLVADTNSYPYALSGGQHAYALNSYNYTNAAAAKTANITANNIGNLFTVYQTTLNVTGASFTNPTSVSAVGNIVGEFNFTAGSGNLNPTVKAVTLSTSGSLIQASTAQVLGLYDASAPSVLLASSTLTGTGNATFNLAGINPNQWVIPYSSAKTLLVKVLSAPINLVSMSNGITGSYQVLLRGITWTDGVTANITSLSPNISMPIPSQNITGLANSSTVAAPSAVPSVTISANPPSIALGQSTTLTWSSKNVTSCYTAGYWPGYSSIVTLPTNGSQVFTATAGNSLQGPYGVLPATDVFSIACSFPGPALGSNIVANAVEVTVTSSTTAASSDTSAQTAIINQSLRNLLDQLSALLKSLQPL